ncbi:MAG: cytochrome P450 [Rhodobacteraceae bacterium]|nr:cytochrome P450 [Paracoccaceae bacterium]
MGTSETSPQPVSVKLATAPLGLSEVVRRARQNVLEIIPELTTRQPMVSGKMWKRWHMVMDPDGLRRILQEKPLSYPKSPITKNVLRPGIGNSLFIAEGSHWRWQRRAAAPVFAMRNIRLLSPVMSAAADRVSERLEENLGDSIDVYAEMVQATFEVISDVTFSGGQAFDRTMIHRAIDDYLAGTAQVSAFDVLGLPAWVPRLGRLISGKATRDMKRVATDAIAERRTRSSASNADLFDLLCAGQDPDTGRRMNDAELRDNLLTFIVAGHETTALTLAWSLYLLSISPRWQEKVRAEANSTLGRRCATASDLGSLDVTRQVIEESLRLYPPAALLLREAQEPDTIGGREVRKGDTMFLPIYALHRNRCLWEDPNQFDPGRFADRRKINRFAYLPFGGGPRVCIGAGFAMQEATIVLATLVSRFRFSLAEGRQPKPVLVLTLRPQGGVWLDISPAQ